MSQGFAIIFLLLLTNIAFADSNLSSIYNFSGPGRVAKEIHTIVPRYGGRVDISTQNKIVMDSQWESGDDFQLWIMDANGTNRLLLTKDHPQVGHFSNGNPAWHPGGEIIVFQSADVNPPGAIAAGKGWKGLTNPGAGVANNLWIIRLKDGQAWKMTSLRFNQGVLHPHFSHRGDKLLWTELVRGKPQKWVMRLADFTFSPGQGPRLANIRTLTPDDMQFYETHSFLPDDSGFLYSATKIENDYRRLEIYRYNLASGQVAMLTDPSLGAWDEHAHTSPDGRHIVWMSSMGIPQKDTRNHLSIKTDWWIMNSDGSGKKRLTYFNEPGAKESRNSWNIASDLAWSPDGHEIIGYLQQISPFIGRNSYPGTLVRIKLPIDK